MRPASQRFFIHSCIYLRILIISSLATSFDCNSLSVLMCRKAVNQSISIPISNCAVWVSQHQAVTSATTNMKKLSTPHTVEEYKSLCASLYSANLSHISYRTMLRWNCSYAYINDCLYTQSVYNYISVVIIGLLNSFL